MKRRTSQGFTALNNLCPIIADTIAIDDNISIIFSINNADFPFINYFLKGCLHELALKSGDLSFLKNSKE